MKSFSSSFELELEPDTAFPLFTPKGEEIWVPDWQPEYLEPTSGETIAGMVFLTGEGDEATIWTCLDYDVATRHARYLRVTPTSRLAFVDVRCRANHAGTDVRVSYDFVPLTAAGTAYLEEISEASFAAMIGSWKSLIEGAMPRIA